MKIMGQGRRGWAFERRDEEIVMAKLTATRVRELLRYDPETGKLFWKVNKGARARIGQEAGYVQKITSTLAYKRVMIDKKRYQVHRIIWLFAFGYWPEGEIDHWDRNGLNNKMENLREATRSENTQNAKRHKNNTSGVKGVYWHKTATKWTAQITVDGRKVYLGLFRSFWGAVIARKAAEKQYGFPAVGIQNVN